MYAIQYYTCEHRAELHAALISLLSEIQARHGISYALVGVRIVPSAFPGLFGTDATHEKELYERDFLPRAAFLKARTGHAINRELRTRSGGYYVAGTVAIVSTRGLLEWYATRDNRFQEYGVEPGVAFLKALLARGHALLDELCTPVPARGRPEQVLTDFFLASNLITGRIVQQARVGAHRFDTEFGPLDWRKAIDIVIDRGQVHWLIEVKTRLHYQAFGQILVYRRLYARANPEKTIRMAVVCSSVDAEVLAACDEYGISVFRCNESGETDVLGRPVEL